MYMYIYVCMYIFIHIYIYTYVWVYMCMYICISGNKRNLPQEATGVASRRRAFSFVYFLALSLAFLMIVTSRS